MLNKEIVDMLRVTNYLNVLDVKILKYNDKKLFKLHNHRDVFKNKNVIGIGFNNNKYIENLTVENLKNYLKGKFAIVSKKIDGKALSICINNKKIDIFEKSGKPNTNNSSIINKLLYYLKDELIDKNITINLIISSEKLSSLYWSSPYKYEVYVESVIDTISLRYLNRDVFDVSKLNKTINTLLIKHIQYEVIRLSKIQQKIDNLAIFEKGLILSDYNDNQIVVQNRINFLLTEQPLHPKYLVELIIKDNYKQLLRELPKSKNFINIIKDELIILRQDIKALMKCNNSPIISLHEFDSIIYKAIKNNNNNIDAIIRSIRPSRILKYLYKNKKIKERITIALNLLYA